MALVCRQPVFFSKASHYWNILFFLFLIIIRDDRKKVREDGETERERERGAKPR